MKYRSKKNKLKRKLSLTNIHYQGRIKITLIIFMKYIGLDWNNSSELKDSKKNQN